MKQVEAFFVDIDRAWGRAGGAKVSFRIIGAAALLLQVDYARGTKDSDILETMAVTPEIRKRLLDLAGPGTELARRHGLFAELVPNGLPFLRQNACWNVHTALNDTFENLHLETLDVVDVAVSKLKRFSPSDESDIEAMIERGLVAHDRLVACFREAIDVFAFDARAEDLPRYVGNLHRVERDVYGVASTKIELPSWVG